jgi:hypothetical protein
MNERFVLKSPESGRYVTDIQPMGFMYGTRAEAWEMTEKQVEWAKRGLPDGPDLIVETVKK